ncbi:MAG TPA: fatty acid--CoA ligase family protein [Stellaceae bacterium]|nr:fatty acid--CoA ligase family protein [Stellaceae bacterium]
MQRHEPTSLWCALTRAGGLSGRWLWDRDASVDLGALAGGSSLGGGREALRGRAVLVATQDQLAAALALIELDGIARRIVLCPPGLAPEHLSPLLVRAGIDAIVGDRSASEPAVAAIGCFVTCTPRIEPASCERTPEVETEWVLLTSGTTGTPKLVVHSLFTLTGAIAGGRKLGLGAVWSTFYDMRRYGGLQVFLRAMLGGGSMVFSSTGEAIGDFLARADAHGVTHISGTPSHWRRALMSPAAQKIAPRYVRLSGEIADQAVLERLRATYRDADIAHAFASTEAGVAFEVGDGLSGFPASLVEQRGGAVELRVAGGSLCIRSRRTAIGYLDGAIRPLSDAGGFVDTGDMVALRDGRFHFVGRRDGTINVGGFKVHPEEVEAVINRHPKVALSLIKARSSPVTGAVVVAEIVARVGSDNGDGEVDCGALREELFALCRSALAPYKVPAVIRFVSALGVGASGKLVRSDA